MSGITLTDIDWPNQITKLVFLRMLSQQSGPEKARPNTYDFDLGGTDFSCFNEEELELILREYIEFLTEDLGELFEVASNNPLPENLNVNYFRELKIHKLLLHQVDIAFLAEIILHKSKTSLA